MLLLQAVNMPDATVHLEEVIWTFLVYSCRSWSLCCLGAMDILDLALRYRLIFYEVQEQKLFRVGLLYIVFRPTRCTCRPIKTP